MRGTRARYLARTEMHSKQMMSCDSPQAAKRETTACAPAGVNVSSGIPSAELATMRPLKMELRLMGIFMNTTKAKSQSASL